MTYSISDLAALRRRDVWQQQVEAARREREALARCVHPAAMGPGGERR